MMKSGDCRWLIVCDPTVKRSSSPRPSDVQKILHKGIAFALDVQ